MSGVREHSIDDLSKITPKLHFIGMQPLRISYECESCSFVTTDSLLAAE